jgi:hypothetical protein
MPATIEGAERKQIMSDTPRDLERLQRWMQAVICHPEGVAEGIRSQAAQEQIEISAEQAELVVNPSQAQSGIERLGIYSRAYYARLLECMQEEFPILRQTLGHETFDEFAFSYLQDCPSRSYTLGRLGEGFSRFLRENRPPAEEDRANEVDWVDFLIELADMERAIGEVFDGPGSENGPELEATQLLSVAPEYWADARVTVTPSLRLLRLQFPLNDFFTAAREGSDPPIPSPRETWLALTRRQYVVRRHELSRPQYELLMALAEGQTVGEAIGRAIEHAALDMESFAVMLREWFQTWAAAGFFTAIELPAER